MSNRNELVNALAKLSFTHWEEKKAPLLLSDVPRSLELEYPHIDRASVLGEQSLKAFAKETAGDNSYRVIEHPTQRPKVGLLPSGNPFEFEVLEEKDAPHSKRSNSGNRETVFRFFKLLASLPSNDLEKINIPVSVLVKMMK